MSLLSATARGATKMALKPASMKAGAKTFHTAYKAAPAETLATHIKAHKVGFGINAVGTTADAADIHTERKANRQSTHTGIDTRG